MESWSWNPGAKDRILLAGDESSLDVIRTILATLPANARGQVFVEVATAADVETLDAPGRFSICWLLRERGQRVQRSVDAWLSEMLPVSGYQDGGPEDNEVYAWIAGSGAPRVLTSN